MGRNVLFHYPILNMGGAEKSTLRLMKALADRGWAVTLVLTTGGGQLEPDIDPRVEVVRLRPGSHGSRFVAARGIGARVKALPDLMAYGVGRLVGAMRMMPFFWRRFDAAAVLLHSLSPFFVTRVVQASRRFIWIRNDLKGIDPDGRISAQLDRYAAAVDGYLCVSAVSQQSLLEAVPGARDKSAVIYNILDADGMRALGEGQPDPFPPRPDGTEMRILTVGRLSDRDKAIFRLVRVAQALRDRGLSFRWYLIGDGPDRGALQQCIAAAGMTNHIVLMGQASNPFPAYRHADLVAMVSNHEGLCGVINEAKVSGAAVLAVKVSGIDEQLQDGENGWVIENDETAIIEALSELIRSPEKVARVRNDHYPTPILDDELKLDQIEALFLGQRP
ncbi:MAG: glycosyltransferase [Brevundimonas sp.]|uniref:glycosyltransferase n=1 Tax=Brevundimonas sp. TaxID=1871086 RepID=UPI002AB92292|nr:glycosyltransferase [Brevundimonas sp.]MDZ4109887.1 glycosyltransferase [Brevundimonas sp.]